MREAREVREVVLPPFAFQRERERARENVKLREIERARERERDIKTRANCTQVCVQKHTGTHLRACTDTGAFVTLLTDG